MATKTFKIGLNNAEKQAMAQDVYERLINMSFDVYDSTKTYNEGDFVVYENPADTFKLYKCNDDSVSGSWNSAKWDLATFQDLVDDIEDAVAFVNSKANTDGNYPTMTVGVAESLATSLGNEDNTPLGWQTAGGDSDITTGIQSLEKLIGCKLSKNQYIYTLSNPVFSDSDTGLSASIDENTGELIVVGTALKECTLQCSYGYNYDAPANHWVICWASQKTGIMVERVGFGGGLVNSSYFIGAYNQEFTARPRLRFIQGETYNIRTKLYCTDLTQLLGVSRVVEAVLGISNYTYSSGNNIAGTGNYLNNLLSFLNGKLPTTPSLGGFTECKSAKLETVDYNQWDEETELGGYDGTNGSKTSSTDRFRNKYPIRVKPNGVYYFNFPEVYGYLWVYQYDSEGRYIGYTVVYAGQAITMPSNCFFLNFNNREQLNDPVYHNDISISLYWDGSRLGYEPYQKHEIVLPNVDLNGFLKVDSNGKVYADGDELTPDGSGNKKRYKIVNMGTLTFWIGGSSDHWAGQYFACTLSDAKYESFYHSALRVSTGRYTVGGRSDITADRIICIDSDGTKSILQIKDNYYAKTEAGLADFQSSLNNIYMIYELKEEDDLTANTFSENFYADDFGTMRFVDGEDEEIEGLQGNIIFYKANISGYAESLYARAEGDPEFFAEQDEVDAKNSEQDSIAEGTLKNVLYYTQNNNDIDFNKIKVIDLGSLNWTTTTSYGGYFYAYLDNFLGDKGVCTKYPINRSFFSGEPFPDKVFLPYEYFGQVVVRDSSFSQNATAFKEAMKGVLMAYVEKTSS